MSQLEGWKYLGSLALIAYCVFGAAWLLGEELEDLESNQADDGTRLLRLIGAIVVGAILWPGIMWRRRVRRNNLRRAIAQMQSAA